jgi:hypothetical protein
MLGNDASPDDTDTGNNPESQQRSGRFRVVFALVVAVSLVVLFAPGDEVPSSPPGVDKVVHVTLFAALALSGALAGVRLPRLVVALLAYACGSEVIQGSLGRELSALDALADAVGIGLGIAVLPNVRKRL